MDVNQIIIIAIVVLVALIVVFIGFIVINKIIEKLSNGKENLLKPNTLHEEDTLLNMMDDKITMEYQNDNDKVNAYINEDEIVNVVETDVIRDEKPINPFDVDLTKRVVSDKKIESQNSENKFFK